MLTKTIAQRVDNEISRTNRLPFTNPNHIKSQSYSDNGKISNTIGNGVDDKMLFTEEIHSNADHTNSKYHSDKGIDNNRDIEIGVGNKKLWLDNFLECPE